MASTANSTVCRCCWWPCRGCCFASLQRQPIGRRVPSLSTDNTDQPAGQLTRMLGVQHLAWAKPSAIRNRCVVPGSDVSADLRQRSAPAPTPAPTATSAPRCRGPAAPGQTSGDRRWPRAGDDAENAVGQTGAQVGRDDSIPGAALGGPGTAAVWVNTSVHDHSLLHRPPRAAVQSHGSRRRGALVEHRLRSRDLGGRSDQARQGAFQPTLILNLGLVLAGGIPGRSPR